MHRHRASSCAPLPWVEKIAQHAVSIVPSGKVQIGVAAYGRNATVKVNGVTVASGAASGSLALNTGNNTLTVVVTGQDGVTTKTYTLTVKRSPVIIADQADIGIENDLLTKRIALNQLVGVSNASPKPLAGVSTPPQPLPPGNSF